MANIFTNVQPPVSVAGDAARLPALAEREAPLIVILVAIYREATTPGSALSGNNLQESLSEPVEQVEDDEDDEYQSEERLEWPEHRCEDA